ncbi:MAG TPA: glycoside hydrolase family 44 protein [Gemmatimonadaceae bacterium]|jgi:hypothetical protein
MTQASRLAGFAAFALVASTAVMHRSARLATVDHAQAALRFTIDPSRPFPISRFIYGANFVESRSWDFARRFPRFTFVRIGGNRLSAYNWENNYSNAGNDYLYENDDYLSDSRKPGEAVRKRVEAARASGAGAMVTVPMIGYVAADARGPMDAADATRATRLATRFKQSKSTKGSPLSLSPDQNDAFVYQDEFVNWVDKTFPGAIADATKPIAFSLDNEPDLWSSTHEEVFSKVGGKPRPQSYDEFIATSVDYARAVKRVVPQALVFGPAVSNYAGMALLGRYPVPDPVYGSKYFLDIYLDQMKRAQGQGPRLLDVLDVHYYPESQGDGVRVSETRNPESRGLTEARVQAPRSLWDSTFDEHTWVSQAAGGPVMLLERLRRSTALHYPGTKLAISEYYFGGGDQISGGVAQADVLGIFGRERVFAASIWPAANGATYRNGDDGRAYGYTFGAFDMFLNYDGNGARFGDNGIVSTTSDAVRSSVYASVDSANRLVIVAINKSLEPQPVTIGITGRTATRAQAYVLAAGSTRPRHQADVAGTGGQLAYTMPAMSVTTLVVAP